MNDEENNDENITRVITPNKKKGKYTELLRNFQGHQD